MLISGIHLDFVDKQNAYLQWDDGFSSIVIVEMVVPALCGRNTPA